MPLAVEVLIWVVAIGNLAVTVTLVSIAWAVLRDLW